MCGIAKMLVADFNCEPNTNYEYILEIISGPVCQTAVNRKSLYYHTRQIRHPRWSETYCAFLHLFKAEALTTPLQSSIPYRSFLKDNVGNKLTVKTAAVYKHFRANYTGCCILWCCFIIFVVVFTLIVFCCCCFLFTYYTLF